MLTFETHATCLDIIRNSNDLRSAYPLWNNENSANYDDIDNAAYFLLWYAVNSRDRYRDVFISAPLYEFLTTPRPPYLTILQIFVAGIDNMLVSEKGRTPLLDIFRWYYNIGVQKYRLFPLLSPFEIEAIGSIPSVYSHSGIDISLLDEVIHQHNEFAKRTFDLGATADCVRFLDWMHRQTEFEVAPWLPTKNIGHKTTREVEGAMAQPSLTLKSEGELAEERNFPSRVPFYALNLIGYANAVLGLGEDLNAFATVARRVGAHFCIIDIPVSQTDATQQKRQYETIFSDRPLFPINLFSIPLFETERFRLQRGEKDFSGRYNIGNWAWELSTLPKYWHHAFDKIDEIWAISPFLMDVYSGISKKPAYYMPPLVEIGRVESFDFEEIGLDDSNFVFLTLCDFNSHSARKNPVGSIRAFQAAFPSRRSEHRLIIKTVNGHCRPTALQEVLQAVGDDSRITVVDGPLSRAKVLGLIAAADCFLSLHRSEGFGRVLAEAMLLETPVIATGYSGSNALLSESTGLAVDYQLVPVPAGSYPYAEGSVWAEPSLSSAVDHMRFVATGDRTIGERVVAAKEHVSSNHGINAVSGIFLQRLNDIGA